MTQPTIPQERPILAGMLAELKGIKAQRAELYVMLEEVCMDADEQDGRISPRTHYDAWQTLFRVRNQTATR